MSQEQRIYCCLCAAPCLPHTAIADTTISPTFNQHSAIQRPSWLTHYTALHLSSGASPPIPSSARPLIPNSRPVFIHTYCLSSALRLMSSDHSRRMLQAWSLPKWTGRVNWNLPYPGIAAPGGPRVRGGPARIGGELDGRCWTGLEGQLDRWKRGESHFLPGDLVSPVNLGKPAASDIDSTRPRDCNPFVTLPTHILLQICTYLLDPYQPARDQSAARPRSTIPPTARPDTVRPAHRDLLALLSTSYSLRTADLPSRFWISLVRQQVDQYMYELSHRWCVSPGRAISPEVIDRILAEEFAEPVEAALKAVEEVQIPLLHNEQTTTVDSTAAGPSRGQLFGTKHSARDVYRWWQFSEGWRSRRRVWLCVVSGCAQARDADWM